VSKLRRLRRLVPDERLFDRRVAGESLRALAPDYAVEHSTLGDFFRRPDGVLGLQEARLRLEVEHEARQAEEDLKRKVQERARADEVHDRRIEEWTPPAEPRTEVEARLYRNDAPRGPTSQERYSPNDYRAERVVAAGGGLEQVMAATRLSRANALRNIDAQIMQRALANDTKFPSNASPDDRRLRRLIPDSELIRRLVAREPLRSIAPDYGVSHTTLLRYSKRPAVAKQLKKRTQRRGDRPRGGRGPG
jgi:hypothetical protein